MWGISTVTKSVFQYSEPLPQETVEFIRGIAEDYGKVKNYVYGRYSGIKNMNRLVPVYDVLNEMRHCGLRAELNLPAAYYELAVTEAVSDIRGMWGMLKNILRERISDNENLTPDDRAYLRTVLKVNSIFSAILNRQEYERPYRTIDLDIDEKKLNNLLRRLVRKYLKKPHIKKNIGFKVTPNGYKYKNGALYLTSRKPRRRICIPVLDSNTSDRQIYISLRGNRALIVIALDVESRKKQAATAVLYAYIGYKDMITLSNGRVYGKDLNKLVAPETERLNKKNKERNRQYVVYARNVEDGKLKKAETIRRNNLGKLKYLRGKRRKRSETQNYINRELNRMLETELPGKIVITKIVTRRKGNSHAPWVNRRLARTFGGYIRERLAYKCQLNEIELEMINSKGTGLVCSKCGAEGSRDKYDFVCDSCGYRVSAALNSARNIERLASKTAQ